MKTSIKNSLRICLMMVALLCSSGIFADDVVVRIDAPKVRLAVGETMPIRVFLPNGTEITSHEMTRYGTLDDEVATIDALGVVTGVGAGRTVVTVRNEVVAIDVLAEGWLEIEVIDPADLDNDKMPDIWETEHGLEPTSAADAIADADQDKLSNVDEYVRDTNPQKPDTDGDGVFDGDEVELGLDPKKVETFKSAKKMDSRCVVSILNRVARVRSNGSWVLTNIPATGQQVRARATCQYLNPSFTEVGQSDFVIVPPNGQVQNVRISFDAPIPVPSKLTLTAPAPKIDTLGATLQLTSTITYSNAKTADATQFNKGTNYISSNPAIATVSADGLVTAVAPGGVNISATNEGTLALLHIQVTGYTDTDGDGMPDEWETANGFNPNDAADADDDADNDGLTNVAEFEYGSAPRTGDTDGDGVYDGLEVQLGSNPIDPSSVDMRRALTSIAIKPSSFTITLTPTLRYLTRQLSVIGTMSDGRNVDLTAAARGTIYSSSDLTIINFENADGKAASGNTGTVTITATNNGFTATASGTVRSLNPALSSIAVGTIAMNVEIGGDFAYVAAGTTGLVVVDVANRKVPAIAATLPLPDGSHANDVRLGVGYAYVAAGATGLHIIDVRNPRAPVLVASLDTPGDARDVVLGPRGLAFVADGTGGVRILDVSNPAAPAEIAFHATPVETQGLSLDEHTLVILSGYSSGSGGRLYFVNVQTPTAPVELGLLDLNTSAVDVEARGGFAYVAARTWGMRIVDYRNPAAATEVSNVTQFYPSDVVLIGDWAFFAEELRFNSVPAVLVTNPASPFYMAIDLNALGDPNGRGIDADERYLYLAGDDGKLYIGQHHDASDEYGVNPTATIVAPVAGTTFVIGDPAPIRISVADDHGVASVRTTVNGELAPGLSRPPYAQMMKLPTNITSVTIDVTVTDFGGNVGHASQTHVVGPDPGTTVTGRVLLADGIPATGATVTVFGATAVTDATGTYLLENVSTIDGSFPVSAVYTANGKTVDGTSATVAPVRGGTTNVPDIVLRAGLVVRVTSTLATGSTVTEWQPVEITVVAANDPGFFVQDVYLMLNGKPYVELRSWDLPYTTTIPVRGDANLATIGARVTDNAGNVALATPLHYTLAADPGSTLTGVVKLSDGTPLAGAQVSVRESSLERTGIYVNYLGWAEAAYEELSTTTDANGAYSLPGVNTLRGDVTVHVAKIDGDDVQLIGKSAPVTPVRGQTLTVAEIVAAAPAGVIGKLALDTFGNWTDLHQKRMVVGNGGAAHFFDVTDPTRPKLRGSVLLSDWYWASAVAFSADGTHAVIVSDEARAFVLDVTDMKNPTFRGNVEIGSGIPTSIIIKGNIAVIAVEDLVLVDISNPSAPVELGRTSLPNDASYITLYGNYVIATEWTSFGSNGVSSGISLIDIADPANPTTVSRVPLTEGIGQPVVNGTRAYFAGSHELHMVDYADPANPVFTANVMPLGTLETWSVNRSGSRLFIGGAEEAGTGRIAIADVGANPAVPALTGNITDPQLSPYKGAWINVNATQKFLNVLGWTRRDHPDVPENVGSLIFMVRMPEQIP